MPTAIRVNGIDRTVDVDGIPRFCGCCATCLV